MLSCGDECRNNNIGPPQVYFGFFDEDGTPLCLEDTFTSVDVNDEGRQIVDPEQVMVAQGRIVADFFFDFPEAVGRWAEGFGRIDIVPSEEACNLFIAESDVRFWKASCPGTSVRYSFDFPNCEPAMGVVRAGEQQVDGVRTRRDWRIPVVLECDATVERRPLPDGPSP